MVYATIDDYKAWLGARAEIIPSAELKVWLERASDEIDFRTFERLHDEETLAEFKEKVIKTTCELAGIIYNDESPDGKRELSGYGIGGYTESYVTVEGRTPHERIKSIVRRGLIGTGLIYLGV